jgi:hypothetical protein
MTSGPGGHNVVIKPKRNQMNTKLKLMGAAFPLALLLGAALSPSAMAANGIPGTGPVGPQPFQAWQGWYEYNTYSWVNGTSTSPGYTQITTNRVYVTGATQNECNLNLSNARATVKYTAYNACYLL